MLKNLIIPGFALLILITFAGCGKKADEGYIKYESQYDKVMNDVKKPSEKNNKDVNFDL